jgi:hypothetical protein
VINSDVVMETYPIGTRSCDFHNTAMPPGNIACYDIENNGHTTFSAPFEYMTYVIGAVKVA